MQLYMIHQPNPQPPVTSTTTILLLHCCNNATNTLFTLLLSLFSSSSSYSCSLSLCLLLQRLQTLCNSKRNKEQPAAATTAKHTRLQEIKKPWNTTTERTYTVHRRTDDGGRATRAAPGCSFLAAFGSRFYRGKLVNFVPPRLPASFWFPRPRREVTFLLPSLSSVC
jgi:hypothetical protein